jgi:hypothetical protein
MEDKLIIKKGLLDSPYLAIKGGESWFIVNLKETLQNYREGKKSRIIEPDSEEGKWLLKEKLVKFIDKPLVFRDSEKKNGKSQ